MKNAKPPERASLGEIIDDLTAEARSDDERIWNFQRALQKHVSLPCDGFVIGEPVKLASFNYDGNQRRGVTATCRRSDGREYEVAVSEVLVTTHTDGSRYVAAYRHWMGLVPYPLGEKATPHTAHSEEHGGSITVRNPVELIVLSVKQTTARCRPLQSDHTITLRAGRIWHVIPGEIAVVRPCKQWNYGGTAYLSGLLESTRIDASALGLVPLKLEDQGNWIRQKNIGENKASPSRNGPSRSSPGGRGGNSRWSKYCREPIRMIRFQTRSQNPTTARTLAIRKAQETY